jgi:hypothetical protein
MLKFINKVAAHLRIKLISFFALIMMIEVTGLQLLAWYPIKRQFLKHNRIRINMDQSIGGSCRDRLTLPCGL